MPSFFFGSPRINTQSMPKLTLPIGFHWCMTKQLTFPRSVLIIPLCKICERGEGVSGRVVTLCARMYVGSVGGSPIAVPRPDTLPVVASTPFLLCRATCPRLSAKAACRPSVRRGVRWLWAPRWPSGSSMTPSRRSPAPASRPDAHRCQWIGGIVVQRNVRKRSNHIRLVFSKY